MQNKEAQMQRRNDEEEKVQEESNMMYNCVKDLQHSMKLDPLVQMTPASVSKYQSGKGLKYKMTFYNQPDVSR